MTGLSSTCSVLIDNLNVKAKGQHAIDQTITMDRGAVPNPNENLCRFRVLNQAHNALKGFIDGVHLALAQQNTIGEKSAAGPRTRVNADHQLSWSRSQLSGEEPC